MNKYQLPQPRKFSPSQESEARKHEARIDYVAAHRDEFMELLIAADPRTIADLCQEIGICAQQYGQSFDEALFIRWHTSFHPHTQGWDFNVRPINFEVVLSALTLNCGKDHVAEVHA